MALLDRGSLYADKQITPWAKFWSRILGTMETIRITTDTSRHAGCGGLLGMSEEAPLYIVEHEGLETRLPGVEMVCMTCGDRIRLQDEVEVTGK